MSALSIELNGLYGVLNTLLLIVRQMESEIFETSTGIQQVYTCQKTLEKIRSKLDKSNPGAVEDRVKSGKRKLQWPFSKEETKTLLAEVERHKTHST